MKCFLKTIIISIQIVLFHSAILAQKANLSDETFNKDMQLLKQLILPEIYNSDTLYFFEMKDKEYKVQNLGWIISDTEEDYFVINIFGENDKENKARIKSIKAVPINDSFINNLNKRKNEHQFGISTKSISYSLMEFTPYLIISSWLYEKKDLNNAKKVYSQVYTSFFNDTVFTLLFGNLYFNEMLVEYSYYRNYPKAIEIGKQFNNHLLNEYEYSSTAKQLTKQLSERNQDFKELTIPDSAEWSALKQTITRKEQFEYLLESLRLLNCIQMGQPMDINLFMEQISIPYYGSNIKDTFSDYWEFIKTYKVINPFQELILMKPKMDELHYFLPHLLDTTFIPTFSYWRDFSSGRNLFRYYWLIDNIIYNITNKLFIDRKQFDTISLEEKKKIVKEIADWIEENKSLNEEMLITKTLKETFEPKEMKRALSLAMNKKYDATVDVFSSRINDFDTIYEYSFKNTNAYIAEAMYVLGNSKHKDLVHKWLLHSENKWVTLWSSLFLMKNDPQRFNVGYNKLKKLLKNDCDGNSYYPYAVYELLTFNNEKAFNVAEGILSKEGYTSSFISYWYFHQGIIKSLLLAKSDKALGFLMNGLNNFDKNTRYSSSENYELHNCDDFISMLDEWSNEEDKFSPEWSLEKKKAHSQKLQKWLMEQFELIQQNKNSLIIINAGDIQFSEWKLDAAPR